MSKVLLINPNYYERLFSGALVKAAISRTTPPLGLITIAGAPLKEQHDVKILDMNALNQDLDDLERVVREFQPDIVGITSTTPLIYSAYAIADRVKEITSQIKVVAGGPHPSALPREVLEESRIDYVVQGEGDYSICHLLSDNDDMPNIYRKVDGKVVEPKIKGALVSDLNSLPMPGYHLLDVQLYEQPELSSQASPVAYVETSRGCFGNCIYCNKNINGKKLRFKSPERVVEEIEYVLSLGFKEIHIIDDIFTADMDRAAAICELIIEKGLKFPWYPRGGIRVDRVSPELLRLMKKSGCYRIPFGIESGSQRIIDVVKKRITIEQAVEAVLMAKDAGLEVECYFMIGLPTETLDDIEMSIDLAIRMEPHYMKFATTIPLPGTPHFDALDAEGQLKCKEWDKFNFSTKPREIYTHDVLSSEQIEKYSAIAHRRFYLRPSYIVRMCLHTLRKGQFWAHVKSALQTRW